MKKNKQMHAITDTYIYLDGKKITFGPDAVPHTRGKTITDIIRAFKKVPDGIFGMPDFMHEHYRHE